MIITFCGHAQFRATEQCERELLTFPETHVGDSPAQMYLGGYGEFDSFALRCCRKYRETHPQIKLVLVSPYPVRFLSAQPPVRFGKPVRRNPLSGNRGQTAPLCDCLSESVHGTAGGLGRNICDPQLGRRIPDLPLRPAKGQTDFCTRKEQAALPFPDFKKPTEHTDSAGFFRDRKFTSPIPPRR